ncbi:hypothetical protein FQN50_005713 [Emmonsiellopsis sp. PD_5]|nr:hypothetical protein FQN50_005713 [Emmonsiellopsis sp. PD_5]
MPFWKWRNVPTRPKNEEKPKPKQPQSPASGAICNLPVELLLLIVQNVHPIDLFPLKLAGNHRILDCVRAHVSSSLSLRQYFWLIEEECRNRFPELCPDQSHGSGNVLGLAAARGEISLLIAILQQVAHDNSVAPSADVNREEQDISRNLQPGGIPLKFPPLFSAPNVLQMEYGRDKMGKDALHWAAEFGQDDVVKLLIKFGASASTPLPHQKVTHTPQPRSLPLWGSALHLAAANGHESTVQILLHQKAKPIDHGQNAVYCAAQNGRDSVVRLLLKQSRWDREFSRRLRGRALHLAARCGHESTVRLLVAEKAPLDSVDGNGAAAIHHAAERGLDKIAQMLLELGANPCRKQHDGQNPLDLALANGHGSIAELLIKHGASYYDVHHSTLSRVAARGDEACVRILLKSKATQYPQVQKFTVYDKAISEQDIPLYSNEDNSASRGQGVFPALHEAVIGGHLAIATLLLEHGADPNAIDLCDLTPFHFAALRYPPPPPDEEDAMLKLLLDANASPYPHDKFGQTALHLAAQRGNIPLIRHLARVPRTVDTPDFRGRTPLLYAVINRQHQAVRELLDAQADPDKRDKLDIWPLLVAHRGDPVSTQMLEDSGGDMIDVMCHMRQKTDEHKKTPNKWPYHLWLREQIERKRLNSSAHAPVAEEGCAVVVVKGGYYPFYDRVVNPADYLGEQ